MFCTVLRLGRNSASQKSKNCAIVETESAKICKELRLSANPKCPWNYPDTRTRTRTRTRTHTHTHTHTQTQSCPRRYWHAVKYAGIHARSGYFVHEAYGAQTMSVGSQQRSRAVAAEGGHRPRLMGETRVGQAVLRNLGRHDVCGKHPCTQRVRRTPVGRSLHIFKELRSYTHDHRS
jgi:hypothetical protein